ncbi:MAG TPA: hypothetical protein VMM81_09240, partial [Acidimicrobiia bacterium]|nr:hypothetical protein [Acidimicrobiia bacterium]
EVMAPSGGTLSAEAGKASQDAAPSEGEAALTNLLVFVDDYFAIRKHRNVVLREMVERVADLPPGNSPRASRSRRDPRRTR